MTELEKVRSTIDEIDEKMAQLFVERMREIEFVVKYKRENDFKIEDSNREEEIIKKNSEKIPKIYRMWYIKFLKNNIKLSKKFQHHLIDIGSRG